MLKQTLPGRLPFHYNVPMHNVFAEKKAYNQGNVSLVINLPVGDKV